MCPLYGGRLWFKCLYITWKKWPLYGVSALECPLWRGFVITDSLGIRPGQNFLSALERLSAFRGCPLLHLLHRYFSRAIRNSCFSSFASFLLKYKTFFQRKYKEFLSFGLESSIFFKYKDFFWSVFFYFSSSESSVLKYKKNMRLEKSISADFFILELEISISLQYMKLFLGRFFLFFRAWA